MVKTIMLFFVYYFYIFYMTVELHFHQVSKKPHKGGMKTGASHSTSSDRQKRKKAI